MKNSTDCKPFFQVFTCNLLCFFFAWGCTNNNIASEPTKKWQYSITSPKQLVQFLAKNKKLKIMDLRPRAQYELGHLPGALYFPLTQLTDANFYPLGISKLANVLASKGITIHDPILIIDDHGILSSSRAFWILNYLGLDKVYIYTAKITHQMKQSMMMATKEKKYPKSNFLPNINANIIVTRDILHLSLFDGSKSVFDVRNLKSHNIKIKIKNTGSLPWSLGREVTQAIYIENEEQKAAIEAKISTIEVNSITFCDRGKHSSLIYFYGRNLAKMTSHFPGGIRALLKDSRFTKIELTNL